MLPGRLIPLLGSWAGRYIENLQESKNCLVKIASNEVIIQLIKTKCFHVLFYGLEACPLRKSQYNSIDYVINSSFRKVFDTKSQEVIDVCLGMFNCLPVQQVIALRKRIFLRKFSATDNLLCRACTDNAAKEIASLSSFGS